MTNDPDIAAARAVLASNDEASVAFQKVLEILEPLRQDQRRWLIVQLDRLVNATSEINLPDLIPPLDRPQITEGESEVVRTHE